MKDAQKIWNGWYTIQIIVLYKHLAKLLRATWRQKFKASIASNFSRPGYKKILFLSLQPFGWDDFFDRPNTMSWDAPKGKNKDKGINWQHSGRLWSLAAPPGILQMLILSSLKIWEAPVPEPQQIYWTTNLFIKWWGNKVSHSVWKWI